MKTPRYEYSRSKIEERVETLAGLTSPYGMTVRYAVKANPHTEVVSMINAGGIHFDASSSFEAFELLEQGIKGENISLSSQQSPEGLEELLKKGVLFVATSLKQLQIFIDTPNRPDTVAVRINPDMGYGHNNRTSTGGVSASFGIWHEYIPDVLELCEKAEVHAGRLHVHIGSGADPKVWGEAMDRSLELVGQLPDVTSLDIGGGYKIHRYGDEEETDVGAVVSVFNERLEEYKKKTGREISLEIEPGTFMIAHAGVLVASVDDIVDTGKTGYSFLKLNTGMNDFLRTTMYGAQHEIEVMNDSKEKQEYIVVGHNCESGDIFTTAKGDAESIAPRLLNKAEIGDDVQIHDVGAYCASMSAKGYNSFPNAEEVMVD